MLRGSKDFGSVGEDQEWGKGLLALAEVDDGKALSTISSILDSARRM